MIDLSIVTVSYNVREYVAACLESLPKGAAGLSTDRAYENRSMKSQMKAADRSGAAIAVIVGSNELADGVVTLRRLRGDAHDQTVVPRDALIDSVQKAMT